MGFQTFGKPTPLAAHTETENNAMNYTLFELNRLVRSAIERNLASEYWVEAEIAEARTSAGHCYMELVQKEAGSNTPVARASAKCWRNTWAIIQPHFERVTGQPLSKGMKVLLKVWPQFHESYGFSWIVADIDPTFTLGDMQRRRLEIIRTLKEEGVFDLNKELQLSPFAQRVAVVSSENAAGYGDFINQLTANGSGYSFKVTLFSAIMQGERVEQSVIEALDAINRDIESYDCVVIIRGGGATSDLSGFDTLPLAENVANFPLPVITGIGHDRDESVIDLIAHTRVKTPTAAAAFLIDNLKRTADRIRLSEARITSMMTMRMEQERLRLARLAERMPDLFTVVKVRQQGVLDRLYSRAQAAVTRNVAQHAHHIEALNSRMGAAATLRITKERHALAMLEQRTAAADPALMLRRGYSITLVNGRSLRSPADVKEGDLLETRVEKGVLKSKAIK